MPWEGWLTVAVLAVMTVIIARERLGPDLTMFSALAVLTVAQVMPIGDALSGFANPAVATIGTLFVVAGAVKETGALRLISRLVFGTTESANLALVRLVVPTAFLSGFLNNTPIVAMFIPVVREYARRIGEHPSRFLMPLSFAALLGGTCTLIGTSPNLVVSGLLETRNLGGLGIFEIGWVGVPTAAIGIVYLVTVGQRLLKRRTDPLDAIHDRAREYLAEVEVLPDSPLVGQDVESAGLRHLPGLFLAEIRREDGRAVRPVAPEDIVRARDHLVFSGLASTVADLRALPGLKAVDEVAGTPGRALFEVVVSHRSPLIGRTVRQAEFRRRYDAAILAVHRSGVRIDEKIGDISLLPGDTLMLSASPGFFRAWRDSEAFYMVSEVPSELPPKYRRAPLSLIILAGIVLIPATTGVSMLVSALGGLVALLVTGCISPAGARKAVDWSVLLVIGSALGLAKALEVSHAADAIAGALLATVGQLGPLAVLAGCYLLAASFASFISNAASAALVFPIAVNAAIAAHYDPRPFAIAVAMAASAGFSTPIGCHTNLLVYSPGGYRYTDFTRVGLPLNALCLATVLIVLPLVWPLQVAA